MMVIRRDSPFEASLQNSVLVLSQNTLAFFDERFPMVGLACGDHRYRDLGIWEPKAVEAQGTFAGWTFK
jgi:hypothetical protein